MFWQSKLQTEIALLTAEAECIALLQALRETLPMTNLMCEMNVIFPLYLPKPKFVLKVRETGFHPVWYQITTKSYHHAHGILPLKPPPWLNNLHHQRVFHLLLIISNLFVQTSAFSSFAITIFSPYDVLAPRNTSPLLFIHPRLLSTNFHNNNHQPLVSPPANTIHPIISLHWPPPLLLPTAPPPPSGNHLSESPMPLSTHTTNQFPRTPKRIFNIP